MYKHNVNDFYLFIYQKHQKKKKRNTCWNKILTVFYIGNWFMKKKMFLHLLSSFLLKLI